MMTIPTNPYEARTVARGHVRKMISRGYTSADAARETFMACSGPGDPGWEIRAGKIRVPAFGPGRWTFSFAELEAEIQRGETTEQLTLFEMPADGGAAK